MNPARRGRAYFARACSQRPISVSLMNRTDTVTAIQKGIAAGAPAAASANPLSLQVSDQRSGVDRRTLHPPQRHSFHVHAALGQPVRRRRRVCALTGTLSRRIEAERAERLSRPHVPIGAGRSSPLAFVDVAHAARGGEFMTRLGMIGTASTAGPASWQQTSAYSAA
jgi:hypothetical protein